MPSDFAQTLEYQTARLVEAGMRRFDAVSMLMEEANRAQLTDRSAVEQMSECGWGARKLLMGGMDPSEVVKQMAESRPLATKDVPVPTADGPLYIIKADHRATPEEREKILTAMAETGHDGILESRTEMHAGQP